MTSYIGRRVLIRKRTIHTIQKAVTVWLQNLLTDKGSILHELFDKEQLSGLIQSGGSAFQTPWFGQLMTGPQLLAHLAQIHVWFKEYGVNIKE